jgi:predicted Zn-dependent protease
MQAEQQFRERYDHARALFQQGRHEEALQAVQVLLWEHPGNRDLLLSKALCLQALGRPAEALATAREGLALGPDPRLEALAARLEQPQSQMPEAATPVDAVQLLKRLEEQEPRTSPLEYLTTRRAYVIIFLLMFLLLASVGPMLWWGFFGRAG